MELTTEKEVLVKKRVGKVTGMTAVLTAPRRFEFKPIDIDLLKDHEILVKLDGCGICASNIPEWEGREWFSYPLKPGNPGHEGWGKVQEVGAAVGHIAPGDQVVLLNDGAFATHIKCEASKAVVLPPSLSSLPFPGEPLGCVMNIFERSEVTEGQVVVVLGAGFLGATLIQLAKEKGATVIAVSRRESSLQLAEASGADACFFWNEKEALFQYLNGLGRGCQRVIECVGKQEALDLATALIGERGKIIVAGYHQEDLRHVNMQIWNWKGIDIINAHERDPEVYKEGVRMAIKATRNGIINISSLLTHQYSFAQLNEAMETLCRYPDGFTKAYITFN